MPNRVELKADLLGRYSIRYDCPKCQERLVSPIDDVGKPDACPACRAVIFVPGESERSKLFEEQQLALSQREAELSKRQLAKELREFERSRAADERRRELQSRQAAELLERERIQRERRAQYEKERHAREFRQCPSCRSDVSKEARNCGVCGEAIGPTSTRPVRKPQRRLRLVAGVGCAILFFAAYFWMRDSGLRQSL